MQNLLQDLVKLLEQDDRLVNVEGQLLKNKIVELALAMDASLIRLLLSHEGIRRHFFADIDGTLVFDKIKFQQFVSNKEFLPDSYTAFKNKIGLTADGHYLTDSKEVVLAWPYKDCVLEGGQTKEDAKRNEVFWNETLAPDQIDRLLSPKVLTNFKRYDKDGEHEVTGISRDDNLIIKANNLLALHTLKKAYTGKVKLIYIDPPYNTGNDDFQYNDTFNHSTWLTFMKNRLEVAKAMLSDDGAIFVSIDHNELGYMLILLDEAFGKGNCQNIIAVKRGSVTGHKTINQGVVNLCEYVVVYTKNKTSWQPNRVFIGRERNVRYNNFIKNRSEDISNWQFCSLL
jgi:adenine-specific DNA-methyltransferase